MTEREFFTALQQKVRETGEIGDVFPCMVEWNVARFLLRHLWPDALSQYSPPQITGSPRLCFAASETGWNQRIQNIKSRAEKNDAGTFTLHLNKAYVMQAETVLLLLRFEDAFCFATIPFSDSQNSLTWIERNKPHTIFIASNGNAIKHYRLSGTITIDAGNVHPVKERTYSIYSVQVFAREITGLALLAAALAERHSYPGLEDRRRWFRGGETQLFAARENRRLQKHDISLAIELIEAFVKSPVQKHAVWEQWASLAALWKR